MADEFTPLINNDQNSVFHSSHGASVSEDTSNVGEGTIVSPIGEDELPRVHSTTSSSKRIPMVTCGVCQAKIDIVEKVNFYVVTCPKCNEATPIKKLPPGKKYVRCPCNCLLICRSDLLSSFCARSSCLRFINLAPVSKNPLLPSVPGLCRFSCAHCQNTFFHNILNIPYASCPHCQKVSSVDPAGTRNLRIYFILMTLFILYGLVYLIISTAPYTSEMPGIYVPYIIGFGIFSSIAYTAYYFCSMKISAKEGQVSGFHVAFDKQRQLCRI